MDQVSVVLTDAAREALIQARSAIGDDLTLVIGNGCCDSTAPFLFHRYFAGAGEERIARVDGIPVLLDRGLLDLFGGREVVIDAGPDPGGDSFSAETELGVRLRMERLPLPG